MPTSRSSRPRRRPVSAGFPALVLGGGLRFQPEPVLRAYAAWYTANEALFLRRLEKEVRASSPAFATWRADRTMRSFAELDSWLVRTTGIRMTKPEVVPVHTGKYLHHIEIDPMEELQRRSIVPIFCLGAYFGAVLMKRHKHLRYEQYLKTKNFVGHGDMMLVASRVPHEQINPIASIHVLALSIKDRDRVRSGHTLRAFLRHCHEGIREGKRSGTRR